MTNAAFFIQSQEVQITQRLKNDQVTTLHLPPPIFHSPACARMHGENDGHLLGDVVQSQATWSGKPHAHWLQSASEWIQDQPQDL